MSIFTTLRDAVLSNTPQRIVAQRLARIENTENEWDKIQVALEPLAVKGIDGAPGNAAEEACRCIDAMVRARQSMIAMIEDPHGEAAALNYGAQIGQREAEARCRIKEVRW